MELKYTVLPAKSDKTVLYVLKNRFGLSTKMITRLKKSDRGILLNGIRVFTNNELNAGDTVSVNIDFSGEDSENIEAEKHDIRILYEDDCIIALDKPPFTCVHPVHNHITGTLSNYLKYYFQETAQNTVIHPVTRLDRDTSGIVLFAKNSFIQNELIKQMKQNIFIKKYKAIVSGIFDPVSGTINMPIKRYEGSTMLRVPSPDGMSAITHYSTIESANICEGILPDNNSSVSLVEFKLETGRTHQIRVHCLYSKHPIIGDTLYNNTPYDEYKDYSINGLINRQCLHASEVIFRNPLTNNTIKISSELPEDISALYKLLFR